MLELYTVLSWQHQILFWETIITAMITLALPRRTHTPKVAVIYLAWDITLLLLLVTGASFIAWQYLVYAGFYLFGVFANIAFAKQRKEIGGKTGPFGVLVLVAFLLALLVTPHF